MASNISKLKKKMPNITRNEWDEIDQETGEAYADIPGLEEAAGPEDFAGLGAGSLVRLGPKVAAKTATTYIAKQPVKLPIPSDIPEAIFRKMSNYISGSGHINPGSSTAVNETFEVTVKKAKELFPNVSPQRVDEIANDILSRAAKLGSKERMK